MKKIGFCLLCLFLWMQASVFAAGNAVLNDVRFGASKNRIVFDLSAIPSYNAVSEEQGERIILDLDGMVDCSKSKPVMHSSLIKKVSFEPKPNGMRVVIDLTRKASYAIHTLKNPQRVYIEFKEQGTEQKGKQAQPSQTQGKDWPVGKEQRQESHPAEGLSYVKYEKMTPAGRVTAYALTADKKKYDVCPALDGDQVAGLKTVRAIAAEHHAAAAVNSSYFGNDGTIIGLLKLKDTVVSTCDYNRTGVGRLPDGNLYFGKARYMGAVTMGEVSHDVDGINWERSANALIVYNPFFAETTKTNPFGQEYVIRNNKVVKISQGNSVIPKDGYVVSVHGTARDAFANVKVGDAAFLNEDLGEPWNKMDWIQGVGPRLLQDGKVCVTSLEEQFPSDIASGRAPRTAFGVTDSGDYIFMVVDGRQRHSIGCTLTELADLMKKFGAVNALNFDGGGSSEMVLGGKVMNVPSDGRERNVGCALLLLKKEGSR